MTPRLTVSYFVDDSFGHAVFGGQHSTRAIAFWVLEYFHGLGLCDQCPCIARTNWGSSMGALIRHVFRVRLPAKVVHGTIRAVAVLVRRFHPERLFWKKTQRHQSMNVLGHCLAVSVKSHMGIAPMRSVFEDSPGATPRTPHLAPNASEVARCVIRKSGDYSPCFVAHIDNDRDMDVEGNL